MFTIELTPSQAAQVALPIPNEPGAEIKLRGQKLSDGGVRVRAEGSSGAYYERFELNLWLVSEARVGAGAARVILDEGVQG